MRLLAWATLMAAVYASAALTAAVPASAQAQAAGPDRPLLAPAREASVLYRMTKTGAEPIEVRVTTEAGGSPLRIDLPDGAYVIVDQPAHSTAMVVPNEQTVMDLPFDDGPQGQFQLNERMRFIRRGSDTVATLRCAIWDVALDKAHGAVCVSDDGILLRSSGQDGGGRRSLIEAVSVSFAPASASDFVPPADFERISPASQ